MNRPQAVYFPSGPLVYFPSGARTDPNPAEKGGRSLRGAKAGRVVRALCDFPPPLAVSDLAMKAGVDISYASRLLEWLAREGLVTRMSRGPVEAIDRARMIRRWADDYSVLKSNEVRSFLDPRGLSNLLRLSPDKPRSLRRHGFTSSESPRTGGPGASGDGVLG